MRHRFLCIKASNRINKERCCIASSVHFLFFFFFFFCVLDVRELEHTNKQIINKIWNNLKILSFDLIDMLFVLVTKWLFENIEFIAASEDNLRWFAHLWKYEICKVNLRLGITFSIALINILNLIIKTPRPDLSYLYTGTWIISLAI